MEEICYRIDNFEGPLDLLLHLINKNKLNIYDIPISQLLDQYMQQIQAMKETNMEVASEFLEMAARLVFIKTQMLLPKHDDVDELKKELSGELIEYETCKKMASILLSQSDGFNYFVREPAEIEKDKTYHREHKLKEIFDAYLDAFGRGKRKMPPSEKVFTAIVKREFVSVSSKIIFVLRNIKAKKNVRMFDLFREAKSRSDIVATFLAVLELMKDKRVHVKEHDNNEKIDYIELIKGDN